MGRQFPCGGETAANFRIEVAGMTTVEEREMGPDPDEEEEAEEGSGSGDSSEDGEEEE